MPRIWDSLIEDILGNQLKKEKSGTNIERK